MWRCMLAFFQGEFERREIDVAFAEMIRSIGGPLVEQRHYEPAACEDGRDRPRRPFKMDEDRGQRTIYLCA